MGTKTTINNIKDFIRSKPIISTDYFNTSFIEERGGIQFIVDNLFTDDYFVELKNICVKVYLSNEDIMKYKYRPKLLSYDLYDNLELYYIILRVNDLCNIKDFNLSKKYIYLPPKKALKQFLADVYSFDNNNRLTFNTNHKLKHN